MKLLSQGAEAKIYFDSSNNLIVKERIPKSFRHDILDKQIRQFRTRREAKVLTKSAEFINCPRLIDMNDKDMIIKMEYIKGDVVKSVLENDFNLAKKIGNQLAVLHDEDIVHGDLTTSNMIFNGENIYFIDFGLSSFSNKLEDKAVDIHLFKQALESKHYKNWESLYELFLEGYKSNSEFDKVLSRLKLVEGRGRNKH